MPTHRATLSTVRWTLCVEACRYSLPFCQYAIALRVSIGWCPVDCTTNVSSSTSAASLNPASISPKAHCSTGAPVGRVPSAAAAKSSAVHRTRCTGTGAGRAPGGAAGPRHFPASRALGAAWPQGVERVDHERQGLEIDLDASMASAAVNSSTAATAAMGSPA